MAVSLVVVVVVVVSLQTMIVTRVHVSFTSAEGRGDLGTSSENIENII